MTTPSHEQGAGLREKVAALLIAQDETVKHPTPDTLREWGLSIMQCREDPHDGDCTKMPYTCNRCVADEYLARADEVIALSSSTVQGVGGGDARETIAKWMMERSYPTGHGDTVEDLLGELEGHAKARAISQHYGNDT